MRRWIRSHLTFANTVSLAALFVALGGTAMASVIITSNSQVAQNTISGHKPPTGKHANIIAGSVNGTDLANGSVTSSKVAPPVLHNAGLVSDPTGNCSGITDAWTSALGDQVGYYRDLEGRVHLQGVAGMCGSPASGFRIMVLPAGFRPSQPNEYFSVYRVVPDTNGALWVDASGNVRIIFAASGDKVSLDGVSFRCGPSGTGGCP